MSAPEPFSQVESRHASIDPAVRAARGLPEDLIRLCVGIEDPNDLLDDLQHALLEAGAITIAANDFVRIPNAVNKAVEKLALGELRNDARRLQDDREWFVSAPGKVILFGEHAVVHGVVSPIGSEFKSYRPTYVPVDCCGRVSRSALLWPNLAAPR